MRSACQPRRTDHHRPTRGRTTLDDRFPDVLQAARHGADAAWVELYDELAGPLLGYLRAHGAPDPEDTLGEVMLQVVRGLDGFTGDESGFRAWVFTIAHRRLQDAHRRRSRRPVDVTDDQRLEAALPPAATATEPEALAAVSTEQVVALIGRLTDDQREVLLLRLVGGLTTGEVAAVTGRSPEAVKGLSKRGLARLRELTGLGDAAAGRRYDPDAVAPYGPGSRPSELGSRSPESGSRPSDPRSRPSDGGARSPDGAWRARARGGGTPAAEAGGPPPPDDEAER
jgi:RNA polymerase sigma factor (sigma-70 family)